MDFLDFIVFFIWVFIFFIYFSVKRRKFENEELKKYHRIAFNLRVISSLAYSLFILYISPGDSTTLYFPEGINIQNIILKDFSNISILFLPSSSFDQSLLTTFSNLNYFNHEGNFMVTRFVIFFSFLTFGKFIAINFLFSMFAFSGLWRLYMFFYKQNPVLHKQFAIAILYLPSVIFWSSGILKDSLCIGALGWLTYSLYKVLIEKKQVLANLLLFLIFSAMLYLLKSYILLSYLPFFLMYFIFGKLRNLKNGVIKIGFVFFIFILSIGVYLNAAKTIEASMSSFIEEGLVESIQSYQSNYESQANTSESNFSLGVEFDGTLPGLIKMAPAAIAATLFRPIIWESKKISTLMSSLESLALMLFTIYIVFKIGLLRFIKTIFSDPLIFYCFSFAIIFSLFVGATTLNFGSLVRYKIPALPFYLSSLFLIYHFGKIKMEEKLTKQPISA